VFRAGVFVAGLVLVVVSAVAWLLSALLAAPAMFLGLWVWAQEFHWARRLFRAFLHRARALWARMRARPVRWTLITVGGIAAAWGAYWVWK
jgi:hypothetical protein